MLRCTFLSLSTAVVIGLFTLPCIAGDTLTGVVLDSNEKPIVGARVDISTAAPKIGRGIFCPSCYLDCKKWTRTDEEGKFRIDGLDPSLKFRILSTSPGKQSHMTKLLDPSKDTARLVMQDFPEEVADNRVIQGTIVASDGAPIPGALIEPYGAKTESKRWWGGGIKAKETVSDDSGNFKMLLEEDYLGIDLTILADGYSGTRVTLAAPGPDSHTITVPKGTAVTGAIEWNGIPQSGVPVAVVQTERGMDNHFIKSVLAITDAKGRFQFDGLPASQRYVVFTPVDVPSASLTKALGILSTKYFQANGNGETRDLGNLLLQPSLSIEGRVTVDGDAKLPTGLTVTLGRLPAWDLIAQRVKDDGSFRFDGLPPETYEVHVNSDELIIDSEKISFQQVQKQSFGIRLSKSVHDLAIPLKLPTKTTSAAEPANDDGELPEPKTQKDEAESDAARPAKASGSAQPVQLTDEPVSLTSPKLNVRGKVVGIQDGHRIAGATVILRAKHDTGYLTTRRDSDVLAVTKTNHDGRFLFGSVGIPLSKVQTISNLLNADGGVEVLAYADGFGLSAVSISSLYDVSPVQLKLEPEAEIRGIVHDESGTPIPGVRIEVFGIAAAIGSTDKFLHGQNDIRLHGANVGEPLVTNSSGEFLIKHISRNRRAIVMFSSNQYAFRSARISNAPGPADWSNTEVQSDRERGEEKQVLFSPAIIPLEHSRTIKVRIVESGDQIISTGVVRLRGVKSNRESTQPIKAGDSEVSVPVIGSGEFFVTYLPDSSKPAFLVSRKIEIPDDSDNLKFELRLPRGRPVRGRVIDASSGEPVGGVPLKIQLSGQIPENTISSLAITREDGTFEGIAVPGKNSIQKFGNLFGFVGGHGREPSSHVISLNVPDDGHIENAVIELSPGLILSGIATDADGKPARKAKIQINQTGPVGVENFTGAYTDEHGKFEIRGLDPNSTTFLSASQGGSSELLKIDPKPLQDGLAFRHESVQFALKKAIQLTGRVLQNGRPAKGVEIRVNRMFEFDQVTRSQRSEQVVTDKSGKYVVGGLNPGDQYIVEITTKDGSIAPGWEYQSPYVQTVPGNAKDLIELPDAILKRANQSLSGIVSSPDGDPVSGITVSAQLPQGGSLARRDNAPPPWTETNEKGEFYLTQLPDETIELMAYKANPAGGIIHYPARITPKRNQAAIKIVVDPTLLDPLEDLDAVVGRRK